MDHVFWNIGHNLILEDVVRAEGCWLYTAQNRRYLDFESGVWCTPLGHSHPRVNAAIKAQLDNISHTGYCFANPVTEEAAKEILSIVGFSKGRCVFLCSGSEAVEFGVQVLRKLSGKPKLLTLSDSFLGSYGSAAKKREEEWHLLDWSPCASCDQTGVCRSDCKVLAGIPLAEIGGFVFEPGSSSGLVRFPPQSLIKNLVKLIKENNGYVQVNEITTGLGRTGQWFGFQHYGFQPDLVSMGKGLGNGYPVSAAALTEEVMDKLQERSFYYQQSHQNDPLGSAAAKAVITVLREERLIERCRRVGEELLSELTLMCDRCSVLKEVRGRGLMFAVECAERPNFVPAAFIFEALLKRGVIIARRPGLNVLRIDPPLTVTEEDISYFLSNITTVLSEL